MTVFFKNVRVIKDKNTVEVFQIEKATETWELKAIFDPGQAQILEGKENAVTDIILINWQNQNMDDVVDKSILSMSIYEVGTQLWLFKKISLFLGNILKYNSGKGPLYTKLVGKKYRLKREKGRKNSSNSKADRVKS